MGLFFDIEADVRYDTEENGYVARSKEYLMCEGIGPTPYDAARELKGAIEIWLRVSSGRPTLPGRRWLPQRSAST